MERWAMLDASYCYVEVLFIIERFSLIYFSQNGLCIYHTSVVCHATAAIAFLTIEFAPCADANGVSSGQKSCDKVAPRIYV